jgi:hypothetical protein
MDLSAHAHLLRHTFAVVTLEQLQRGHISTLAQLNSEQRGHYTRIDLRRPAGLGPATVGPPIGSHDADLPARPGRARDGYRRRPRGVRLRHPHGAGDGGASTTRVVRRLPMSPTGCPGSSRTMTSSVRKTTRFRRWPARCGRTALVAVGLVQPHSRDLSTSNSQPGEDGSKPCSISQRAARRLRNDHHARITSRSTSVP